MNASRNLPLVSQMRDRMMTSFALELVPRISRAQNMDALSSQATAARVRRDLDGSPALAEIPTDAHHRRWHHSPVESPHPRRGGCGAYGDRDGPAPRRFSGSL